MKKEETEREREGGRRRQSDKEEIHINEKRVDRESQKDVEKERMRMK